MTINEGGQAHAERGDRDGGCGQTHDLALVDGDHAAGEEEGHLVDRPAHVEADHEADDDGEDDDRGGRHTGQEVRQAVEQGRQRAAEHVDVEQRDDRGAEDRDDENRHDWLDVLMPRDLSHPLGDVTGDDADDDGADETSIEAGLGAVRGSRRQVGELVAAVGDETGHHADDEAGTVSDGLSDETGEHRNHEGKGQSSNLQDGLPEAALGDGDAASSGFAADAQGQGDHDAATDHEGDHVGDPGHQSGVEGMPDGTLVVLAGLGRGDSSGDLGGLGFEVLLGPATNGGGQGLLHELGRTSDAVLNTGDEDALAVEAGQVDLGVSRDDDSIGLTDVLGGQLVLDADRPLGLDLDLVTGFLGRLLQFLGCHACVGNTGRTCCDSDVFLHCSP